MHKFYFQPLKFKINNYKMKLIYSILVAWCCTVLPAISLVDSTNNVIQCDYSKYSINNQPCEDMLTCDSMHLLRIQQELQSEGFVKKRFLATCKDMQVVYSYPRNDHVSGDFLHGINMLLAFQANSLVAKVIGYCKDVNYLQVLLFTLHNSILFITFMFITNTKQKDKIIQLKVTYNFVFTFLFIFEKNA